MTNAYCATGCCRDAAFDVDNAVAVELKQLRIVGLRNAAEVKNWQDLWDFGVEIEVVKGLDKLKVELNPETDLGRSGRWRKQRRPRQDRVRKMAQARGGEGISPKEEREKIDLRC
jgi:hypothetical protein